jgi:hypothetical protein
VRVDRDHRLDAVTGDFGEIGIVDSGGAQVADVGVAELGVGLLR